MTIGKNFSETDFSIPSTNWSTLSKLEHTLLEETKWRTNSPLCRMTIPLLSR